MISTKRINAIKRRVIAWAIRCGWSGPGLDWLKTTLDSAPWHQGVDQVQTLFEAADIRQQLWNAVFATMKMGS